MGDTLRLAVGIMGNASSLLLYAAPVLTFKRVLRKRSTEDFSCVPYIGALLNCLLYTWYGLPVVSHKWENCTLVTINGAGIFLETSFIFVYIWFASLREKKKVILILVPVIMVFCVTALVSTFALHDHRHRKLLVGSVGLVASVSMYAAPMVVVKQVIKTKSVEFLPFYLSFFAFLTSILWMAYGLLSHDIVLASPNLVGFPLGAFQLVLHCMYRKRGIIGEQKMVDPENNNGEKLKIQQPLVNVVDGKN